MTTCDAEILAEAEMMGPPGCPRAVRAALGVAGSTANPSDEVAIAEIRKMLITARVIIAGLSFPRKIMNSNV